MIGTEQFCIEQTNVSVKIMSTESLKTSKNMLVTLTNLTISHLNHLSDDSRVTG